MNTWQWVATILVNLGLGVVLAELVRGFMHRKNMDANTAKQLAETAAILVQPLEKRVKTLSTELETTEGRASKLAAELLTALDEVATLRRALDGAHQEIRSLRALVESKLGGPEETAP